MASSSGMRSRKRARPTSTVLPAFPSDLADNTPSDPALFSSDPPDPSAECYFSPRRKRMYRGTWWGPQERGEGSRQDASEGGEGTAAGEAASGKRRERGFERNFDSGIWLGSDGTVGSMEGEGPFEQVGLLSDDTVPMSSEAEDEGQEEPQVEDTDEQTFEFHPLTPPRMKYYPEAESVMVARRRIVEFAETGDLRLCEDEFDFAEYADFNVPGRWASENNIIYEADAPRSCRSAKMRLSDINLPQLTDDMVEPLVHVVALPDWSAKLKAGHAGRATPDDGENELDSEEDMDPLRLYFEFHALSNALQTLPPKLFDCENMTRLFLGSNNLDHLSARICKLRRLGYLCLAGNRLRWLPGEVLDLVSTTLNSRFYVDATHNPLVQPFPYLGVRQLLEIMAPDAAQDNYRIGGDLPPIWHAIDLGEMNARVQRLRDHALPESDAADAAARASLDERKRWLIRWQEHFIAMPELIWARFADELRQSGRSIGTPAMLDIVRKWGDLDRLIDEQELLSADINSLEHRFQRALANMLQHIGPAMERITLPIAASPVCLLSDTGRPVNSSQSPPSQLPVDQYVVPARLLAVPEPLNFRRLGFHGDVLPNINIRSLDGLRPQTTASPKPEDRVRSLYAMALNAASKIPELPQLHTLLPEDTFDHIRRSLDIAVQARQEGGRTCYRCQRSFIVPRAEWIEYHSLIMNTLDPARVSLPEVAELFLPFLRQVCSWSCVPEFKFDDGD